MSQRFLSSLNIKTLLSVVVPALLIASLSVYVLGFRPKPNEEARVLLGKPLAAYEQFYPIRANETGALYLDKDLFCQSARNFDHVSALNFDQATETISGA